mmetsp:Transcript_13834/g.34101  ORF Transcript_13834/g.34101 Transcript_13834/m.34101 type:complete len:410 (-) Transcript_13834:320-1549(-)
MMRLLATVALALFVHAHARLQLGSSSSRGLEARTRRATASTTSASSRVSFAASSSSAGTSSSSSTSGSNKARASSVKTAAGSSATATTASASKEKQIDFGSYPFIDSLNPTAPFDAVGDPVSPSTVLGMWNSAQVFPPYLIPESFPGEEAPAKDQMYQTRIPKKIRYGKGGHEILKYDIRPADATWPNGNLFFPKTEFSLSTSDSERAVREEKTGVDGVVIAGPAERIPWEDLPIAPPGEKQDVKNFDTRVGVLDYIPEKVAKYFDQVHDAERSCENDVRSEECVSKECPLNTAGVSLVIGNVRVEKVEILEALPDLGLYSVKVSSLNDGGRDCSALGCTVLRQCYHEAVGPYAEAGCSEKEFHQQLDAFRTFRASKESCPAYHEMCSAVVQKVPEGTVRYGGKVCVLA